MSATDRILGPDGNALAGARSIEDVVEIVGKAGPGHYDVDLVAANPDPAGEHSRSWGVVIKSPEGLITLDAPPWID